MSCESEEEGEGVFCRRDRVSVGCVDDEDPRSRSDWSINVVDAHPRASNDAKFRPRRYQGGIDLNLRTYDECIRLFEGGNESFARLTREIVNAVPRRCQRVDANRRDRLGDDDSRHGGSVVTR